MYQEQFQFEEYNAGNHVYLAICLRCCSLVPRSKYWQDMHEERCDAEGPKEK